MRAANISATRPTRRRHAIITSPPNRSCGISRPMDRTRCAASRFPRRCYSIARAWKIRYVQYADADFSARVLPSERLGIMGPVLRGTTGEYLAVTFLNRSWRPLSMHPHGVKYDKDSEGTFYKSASGTGGRRCAGREIYLRLASR